MKLTIFQVHKMVQMLTAPGLLIPISFGGKTMFEHRALQPIITAGLVEYVSMFGEGFSHYHLTEKGIEAVEEFI